MPDPIYLQQLPDRELIALIKSDPDYISVVYKKTREYCLRFMYKMNTGSKVKEEDLLEIYQEAVIILYEKIIYEDFELTNNASIQTYLTSVCRFKLLDEFKKKFPISLDEEDGPGLRQLETDPGIEDELQEIRVQNEVQYNAIQIALEKMRKAGGNCYEILTLYWYHGKKHEEIAELLGYTTADSAKNQKSRCQKKLQKIAHEEVKRD
ncbi:RNA polymerase sigma factor [Salegentibacter maritimus]|uniref:RNA polymerase sigma factor n=1 Tax=Salegentibacter maritimus TaxID=2794347 RepID=UPI0018E46656|nr:sigma-70 family RNA polymerase sigma factor [Salegentibacter maritimus]MBI6115973.1 sigma-70 family RNA polymerase sigma factor [Salegentibacter maritimus]